MTAAPLTGRRLALEPLAWRHMDALHRLSMVPEMAGSWPFTGEPMAVEQLEAHIWSTGPIQYAVVRRDSGDTIGLTQGLHPDLRNGTVGVGFAVAPDLWRAGWPLEAVVLFIDHLLTGRFRKLYFRMTASTAARLGSGLTDWLTPECVHRQHVRTPEGGYDDMTIYGLDRSDWDPEMARLLTGRRSVTGTAAAVAATRAIGGGRAVR
jgi:RimJ/RimL family protein N-acetyltransferase